MSPSVVKTGILLSTVFFLKMFNIHFEVFTKETGNPALADLLTMQISSI